MFERKFLKYVVALIKAYTANGIFILLVKCEKIWNNWTEVSATKVLFLICEYDERSFSQVE